MIRKRDAAWQRKWRKENPTKQQERYERWRIKQEAKLWDIAGRPRSEICELCGKLEITVFDHCHLSDVFRGWLCDRCNKVLGLVNDNPDLLNKMIYYLEKFMKSAKRKSLPKSEFGLPGERKYPVDTKGRAANAKARATQQVKKGNLSPSSAAKIKAKANRVLGK